MKMSMSLLKTVVSCMVTMGLVSCASMHHGDSTQSSSYSPEKYAERLPKNVNTNGQKLVVVNPRVHAWGAYDETGDLVRAGIATAGGVRCPPDDDEPSCRTEPGVYRITSLGDESCASRLYPRPHGGGLMPFCMYFHNGEALHGSPDPAVIEANVSHGCVRMRIPDAQWMRYNFAEVGTRVKVLSYDE